MRLRTIKLGLTFASLSFAAFLIVSHICVFSQYECLSVSTTVESSMHALLQRISLQESLQDAHHLLRGLNHHLWEKNCVRKIETLCNFPVFPKAPDQRHVIYRTEIKEPIYAATDAHRLLGFLIPSTTGEYHFGVASNGFAEVWLSGSENWRTAIQIASVTPLRKKSEIYKWEFNSFQTQISSGILLEARARYYIEILYALGTPNETDNFLQVTWKRPQEANFEVITGHELSLFTNDIKMAKYKVFDDDLPMAFSCISKLKHGNNNKHMRIDPERIPFLDHTAVNKALPYCEYQPSYVLTESRLQGFKQFDGVRRHIQRTYIYPFPVVDGIIRLKRSFNLYYEFSLDEEEAWSIVYRYMEAIELNYFGRYSLLSIRRVEKKEDRKKGAVRYFLEVVVSDVLTDKKYILAEYVFQPNGTSLCYPVGLQWNRTADVYLIVTAKNLGRWIHHFIKNVENIIQESRDEHLHVVVFDFESPDVNLTNVFQRSSLKNYHYITKSGNYSRTISFTEAINSIKDPSAIVVTLDLHLDIGSRFINEIRKQCLGGKTVYAPYIVFLNCSGSSSTPKGHWYHYSFGTIAMHKKDWKTFGGFSEDFRNKITWGAEDWDLIDRAVKGGLEIERKRSPWVYHYHHTKDGMW